MERPQEPFTTHSHIQCDSEACTHTNIFVSFQTNDYLFVFLFFVFSWKLWIIFFLNETVKFHHSQFAFCIHKMRFFACSLKSKQHLSAIIWNVTLFYCVYTALRSDKCKQMRSMLFWTDNDELIQLHSLFMCAARWFILNILFF